jgi:hypothetical protein
MALNGLEAPDPMDLDLYNFRKSHKNYLDIVK